MTFLGWLQLAFIVLKLTEHIAWSWWLVLSPVWFALVYALIKTAIEESNKGKRGW